MAKTEQPVSEKLIEEYEKARKAGKTRRANVSIFKFQEPGDRLIGVLREIEPFEEGQFDQEVNRYVLDTPDGRFSCILGSAADKSLEGNIEVGDRVAITFNGQQEISGGRTVNIFDVETF